MYSTKNFLTARLCLVFLIIFNHVSGEASTYDFNQISVTDFKYYRKIFYKNQQLLIYKSKGIKNIFYLSDQNQQDFTKKNNQITLNIKIDSIKNNHKISYTNSKILYSSNLKSIYFENASTSLCAKTLEENYIKLGSRSIIRSIQSVNVTALVDNNTCNAEQKEKLGLYLSDMLTTENAWLTRCYGNESVKKLIEADPNYLNYTGSVYSKYLRLVQKINDNQNPIQISCKVDTKGKLGSFDETTNPAKISLDFENLNKKAGSDNKLSDAVKATLGHELFHYGDQMQSPGNPTINTCVNESYAKIFTDICTESDIAATLKDNKKSITLKIPTSDQVAATCSKNPAQRIQTLNSMDITSVKQSATTSGSRETGTQAIRGSTAQQTQQQNAAVQNNLQETVTPSDFTQPSDSDFATLASNTTAGTSEGSSYNVSANSSFGQTVQKTMNAFANSGNNLTNKLNTAVAATTNTAQAGNTTLATTGNTTSTTTGSTYVPTSTSTTTQTNDAPNTNSRMPANVENNPGNYAGKTSLGTSGQPSEMGGGTSGGPANNSFSTGSGNLGNTNAGKGGSPQGGGSGFGGGGGSSGGASSGGGSSTGSAPSQKTAQQKQAEGAEMVKTIQSLKAFNTVTGGQYQEIKKYYSNPLFLNMLKTYDMRIMVKNPTGQYVALGVDSKDAKKVFNDDGQILKTVEEKK